MAVNATADMTMICHQIDHLDGARAILERAPVAALERSMGAVAAAKQRLTPPEPHFSEEAFHALDAEVWDLRVAVMGEEGASHRAPEDGKRSPVEGY